MRDGRRIHIQRDLTPTGSLARRDRGRKQFFFLQRTRYGPADWRAFLKQKLGGPHHRLSMKPPAHDSIQNGVGKRQNGHTLMMRHVGADNRRVFSRPQTFFRVVQSLIEPERSLCAEYLQTGEIRHGLAGIHHGGQRRRIGRDHEVLGKAPLHPETRHVFSPVF